MPIPLASALVALALTLEGATPRLSYIDLAHYRVVITHLSPLFHAPCLNPS